METTTAVVFIGTVIAGVTQLFKLLRDKNYTGAVVIGVAVAVGAVVSLVDTEIGVQNINLATGIMLGFGAAGVVAGLEKIGVVTTTRRV